MGIIIKVSEISRLIIYFILIINACCDISLINCDIHKIRQEKFDGLAADDFKIDPVELQEHIMSGLNMTTKPDIDLVSSIEFKLLQRWNCFMSRGTRCKCLNVLFQFFFVVVTE